MLLLDPVFDRPMSGFRVIGVMALQSHEFLTLIYSKMSAVFPQVYVATPLIGYHHRSRAR